MPKRVNEFILIAFAFFVLNDAFEGKRDSAKIAKENAKEEKFILNSSCLPSRSSRYRVCILLQFDVRATGLLH